MEQLNRVSIAKKLLNIYEPEQAEKWFHSPQIVLGGDVPNELIDNGQIELVNEAVDCLLDCNY